MDPSDMEPDTKRRKIDHEGDSLLSGTSDHDVVSSGPLSSLLSSPAYKDPHAPRPCVPSLSPDVLGSVMEAMASRMSAILDTAKKIITDSATKFADCCGPVLVKIFSIYESSFQRLGISSKKELDALCGKNFRHSVVRDSFEYLSEVEMEIRAAGGRVVVVSLADPEGAQEWLSQMDCTFDFLLDREQLLYKAIGLGQSIAQVWSIAMVSWYSEQHVRGRPSYRPSKHDNIHQLGGDLLVGSDGRVLLVHTGTTPLDRPNISSLLALIKENQEVH